MTGTNCDILLSAHHQWFGRRVDAMRATEGAHKVKHKKSRKRTNDDVDDLEVLQEFISR
jgi:hypothetical protein